MVQKLLLVVQSKGPEFQTNLPLWSHGRLLNDAFHCIWEHYLKSNERQGFSLFRNFGKTKKEIHENLNPLNNILVYYEPSVDFLTLA